MIIGNQKITQEKLNEYAEEINNASAEEKSAKIVEVTKQIADMYNEEIEQIINEAKENKADSDFKERMGYRILNEEEKEFYQSIKNIAQDIKAPQHIVLPQTIVDLTMQDVRTGSELLKYVDFNGEGLNKFIVSEKTGTFAWGKVTDAITGELTGSISQVITEFGKLNVLIVIPKSMQDLKAEYIDKFVRGLLKDQLIAGMENGVLVANGKEAPVGIYKKDKVHEDGTHQDKAVDATIKNFTPKGLAKVKKYLSNNGKRKVPTIVLVCNPADRADYVDPAMLDALGNNISSDKRIVVVESLENPQGKAAFYAAGTYKMGCKNMNIKQYDQTKAIEDCDVYIGKIYANGKAIDDNCSFPFDVTKLEEYVPQVMHVTPVPEV